MLIVMVDRIIERKMSMQQVTDAVNNLIDTFKYPVPTVAEIVGWDKTVKVYTHQEIVELIPKGYDFSMFEKITIKDQLRWILK